jgi:predicted small metal-binding protein
VLLNHVSLFFVRSSISKFIFIGGETMARKMSCGDVVPDCDFVARGETDEEVMGQVAEHARTAHAMDEVTPELAAKAQAAIRDEQ